MNNSEAPYFFFFFVASLILFCQSGYEAQNPNKPEMFKGSSAALHMKLKSPQGEKAAASSLCLHRCHQEESIFNSPSVNQFPRISHFKHAGL